MKQKALITLLLIFATMTVNANEVIAQKIKDVYKSEKLFTNTNMENMSMYGYSTDMEFKTALEKLKNTLGASWEQQKMDPAQKELIFKKSGQKFNGMEIFNKGEKMISITHLNMPMEGRKYLLQLSIITTAKK